jgi:L-lysine exporter family protein LysE/ArgO
VLNQGLHRNHHLTVAHICAMSDACSSPSPVRHGRGPGAESESRHGHMLGAVFLFWYGHDHSVRALRSGGLAPENACAWGSATVVATLAVTLPQPSRLSVHRLLLGSIGPLPRGGRLFLRRRRGHGLPWPVSGLGLAPPLLPFLKPPSTILAVLDVLVGLTMWGVAASLSPGPGLDAATVHFTPRPAAANTSPTRDDGQELRPAHAHTANTSKSTMEPPLPAAVAFRAH